MTQRELKCPQCARAIAPEDTIAVREGRPFHLDCKKPRTLTPEELTEIVREHLYGCAMLPAEVALDESRTALRRSLNDSGGA